MAPNLENPWRTADAFLLFGTGPTSAEELSCEVCQSEIEPGEQSICHKSCGQAYHRECLEKWGCAARGMLPKPCPHCRGVLGPYIAQLYTREGPSVRPDTRAETERELALAMGEAPEELEETLELADWELFFDPELAGELPDHIDGSPLTRRGRARSRNQARAHLEAALGPEFTERESELIARAIEFERDPEFQREPELIERTPLRQSRTEAFRSPDRTTRSTRYTNLSEFHLPATHARGSIRYSDLSNDLSATLQSEPRRHPSNERIVRTTPPNSFYNSARRSYRSSRDPQTQLRRARAPDALQAMYDLNLERLHDRRRRVRADLDRLNTRIEEAELRAVREAEPAVREAEPAPARRARRAARESARGSERPRPSLEFIPNAPAFNHLIDSPLPDLRRTISLFPNQEPRPVRRDHETEQQFRDRRFREGMHDLENYFAQLTMD